ncbi:MULTISPECIES: Rossmann-like and DUF2520 domain-containing protein [Olivibacter]|uniref:Rossmann-like and DUF2520 domain-containing protein n=1 Tax=Olivibacter jilunii TaxID=985016 RepID=A0ABW6AY33_9SPHI|nr:F420-dependent NADP oxidoreductase [Olivibacter sp. UJ_SKK_5.1]MDX3913319.1 F420-dependent NADP oxidoreductase [Pseudosphingobacterium sp.]
MEIVILGSGNVATHLAFALKKAEYHIKQVYSRDIDHAKHLADGIGAEPIDNLLYITTEADVYVIAVKDEAILEVASELRLRNKILLHTSGSTDMDVLKPFSSSYGVLYPLQTISKEVALDFSKVPLILEFSDQRTKEEILNMAFKLSPIIHEYNSEQRRCLHLAAVIACNFSNYLYAIAHDFLTEKKVDFDLLKPLISETAHKIQSHDPNAVQTGPAVRNDGNIIRKHLDLLKAHPNWQQVYELISEDIVRKYWKEDKQNETK